MKIPSKIINVNSLLLLFLISATQNRAMAGPLLYDFTTPEAGILNGINSGIFTVDGTPLGVQGGTIDAATGAFTVGGLGRKLCTDGFGLGVDSPSSCGQIQADTGGDPEAVVFNFSSTFTVHSITLAQFFTGEDVRIFADGALLGDFIGTGTMFGDETTIDLPPGISTLAITSLDISSDDSDFWLKSISGVRVVEPATLALLCLGLAVMGCPGTRSNRNDNPRTPDCLA